MSKNRPNLYFEVSMVTIFFEFNVMRFSSTYSTLRNNMYTGFQEFSVFNFNKVESYCKWGSQKAWEWDLKLLP